MRVCKKNIERLKENKKNCLFMLPARTKLICLHLQSVQIEFTRNLFCQTNEYVVYFTMCQRMCIALQADSQIKPPVTAVCSRLCLRRGEYGMVKYQNLQYHRYPYVFTYGR